MKRILSTMKRKGGSPERNGSRPVALPQGDSPEAVVVREVTAFCESGAPNSQGAGDEYLHLPAIVDAAESSPTAAREAAATIRRYLTKEYYQRGYAQYNAIMLSRILTDNPARPFTQNFDAKFVSTVKELLREGKDTSVQQILRETLDYFEAEKVASNDSLIPLIEMWRKEKGKAARLHHQVGGVYPMRAPGVPRQSSRPPRGLPPPDELAARIEEAKTTARLLLQTIQSTPQAELPNNDLVQEFAERARAAHKSIQTYMGCENPRPDEDTMLTLIETNDQLNIAMSKHQRALLQARKSTGMATPSPQPPTGPELNSYMPQHTQGHNVYGAPQSAPGPNVYSVPGNPQPGYNPQPNYGPYSSSPPRQQTTAPTPVSPIHDHQHEQFAPPPGPPPNLRTSTYGLENAYATSPAPPPLPTRTRPESGIVASPTSAAAYGVAENPFTDNAYAPESQHQPPQQKQYSLFDRAQHHINNNSSNQQQPQEQSGNSGSGPLQRPGGDYEPTQSYMHRQESSANNITMHGGSPPAAQHDPAGPADAEDVNGVERRMGDLRV